MDMSHSHAFAPAFVNRLKRAEGHLRRVLAMIEEARPCVDIAQQLHAVESAIGNAKRELIHDHIEKALGEDSVTVSDVRELKQLSKYL
jgi:uncharacterized protein